MSFELAVESFPPPDGPLRYANVPWDSQTFGYPIYEVMCAGVDPQLLRRHLPEMLTALAAKPPLLVWSKVGLEEIEAGSILTGLGFYPIETMVGLQLSLERFKPVVPRGPASLQLRPATSGELPALCALARSAFHADRFHLDPHLPKSAADERFARWLERALRDAEPVFVYEDVEQQRMLGFYHIRSGKDPRTVYLSLGAIDLEYQRLGLGLLLYQAILLECRTRGYASAETHISLNNLDVLNLFSRLGCSFRNPVLTLHWYRGKQPKK